jgi:hypothetical protein
VSLWHAALGGLLGTFVLTTMVRGASEARLTRMDLPFLLGTAVTTDRARAKAIGYVLHFLAGLVFAMGYGIGFLVLGRAGWLLGAAFGVIHGLFAGSVLVNALLPLVHPNMGTPMSGIGSAALLEPPGFMMLNYGRATPIVSLMAHTAYGVIIGLSVSLRP